MILPFLIGVAVGLVLGLLVLTFLMGCFNPFGGVR